MAADAIGAAVAGPPPVGLPLLLFLGSSVHVAATASLFGFSEVRRHAAEHRTRYLVVPLLLMSGGAAAAALASTRQLSIALLLYFGWQLFHYQKQNLGLAALAARARGAPGLTMIERRVIVATAVAGGVELALRAHLLQLGLDDPAGALSTIGRGAAAIGYLASIVIGLVAITRRTGPQRPRGFVATYVMGLLFPAPIFGFQSPYAALGGITIAHGLQYLLLTGMVVGGPVPAGRPSRLAYYAAVALGFGLLLNFASHLHSGSTGARVAYGLYLGVVMTHFVVDAGLWRLRDPFARQFMSARLPWLLTPSRGAPQYIG